MAVFGLCPSKLTGLEGSRSLLATRNSTTVHRWHPVLVHLHPTGIVCRRFGSVWIFGNGEISGAIKKADDHIISPNGCCPILLGFIVRPISKCFLETTWCFTSWRDRFDIRYKRVTSGRTNKKWLVDVTWLRNRSPHVGSPIVKSHDLQNFQ